MNKCFGFFVKVATSLLAVAVLSGCGGGIEELANGVLYPFAAVNKSYPVPATPPAGYGQTAFDFTDVDGKTPVHVHAWTFQQPKGSNRTIVYFHGNGENLQALWQANFLQVMEEEDANFIVIDYPGLGLSTGTPSQYTLVGGATAAIQWAKTTYPNNEIIVWGRSLGCGVAVQATVKSQSLISKLVLTSAWTSFMDVAIDESSLAKQIPAAWIAANAYNSLAAAPQIHLPVLMHHGDKDTTIPIKFGLALKAGFTNSPSVNFITYPGRTHNDIFLEQGLWQSVETFIK